MGDDYQIKFVAQPLSDCMCTDVDEALRYVNR